jgi:hypothetical protein
MEQRSPIWRVAANILNKQSRTADKVWSSSSDFEQDADNTSPLKLTLLRKKQMRLRPGLILCYDLSNGKVTRNSVHGMLGTCTWQVSLQQQPGS